MTSRRYESRHGRSVCFLVILSLVASFHQILAFTTENRESGDNKHSIERRNANDLESTLTLPLVDEPDDDDLSDMENAQKVNSVDTDRIMTLLRKIVTALHFERNNHRRMQEVPKSAKRIPQSRFVRIGRKSLTAAGRLTSPDTIDYDNLSDKTFVPTDTDDSSKESLSDENDFPDNQDITDEEDIAYPEKRARNFPRSRFVRIGRRGKRAAGRIRELENILSRVRRSYVMIGKMPASVFLQRDEGVGDEDGLRRMRSPGYQLTTSAIIRAGKRS